LLLFRDCFFEIDTVCLELRRLGCVEPVEPPVFDLLLFLARMSGVERPPAVW
jgi:hypothetical protein